MTFAGTRYLLVGAVALTSLCSPKTVHGLAPETPSNDALQDKANVPSVPRLRAGRTLVDAPNSIPANVHNHFIALLNAGYDATNCNYYGSMQSYKCVKSKNAKMTALSGNANLISSTSMTGPVPTKLIFNSYKGFFVHSFGDIDWSEANFLESVDTSYCTGTAPSYDPSMDRFPDLGKA